MNIVSKTRKYKERFLSVKACSNLKLALKTEVFSLFIRSKTNRNLFRQKNKLSFLKSQYGDLLLMLHDRKFIDSDQKIKNIWFFWWQGKTAMPPIVEVCYQHAIKNFGSLCPVFFLDKDNFFDYVNIPDFILEKVKDGVISLTHFSDILRVSLLNQRGGMWIDATLLVTTSVPKCYFNQPFFSLKSEYKSDFVSQCKWTGFCMGGSRNYLLFRYMEKLFEEHWKKYNSFIDYYFIDYGIRMAYDSSRKIMSDIDKFSFEQNYLYDLYNSLGEIYVPKKYQELLNKSIFFKLSWKENFPEYIEGKETIYGHLIHTKINC